MHLKTFPSLVEGQTITFRSLAPTSPPANSSFSFDGSNSDIAQQLYIRYQAGDAMDTIDLDSVPTVVMNRLDPFQIDFDNLPGLIQRVVLWDSGFALSPDNNAVQIWTLNDFTMADLAIPRTQVEDAGCTFVDCVQPNNVSASYVQGCTGDQMLSVSRCVVDTFQDATAAQLLTAMWGNGGDSDVSPQIRLREHKWTDPETEISYSVYAVHTIPSSDDVTWKQCPSSGEYASLIVPCHRRDNLTSAEEATMVTPTGSSWVSKCWFCWRRRATRRQQLALEPCDLHNSAPYLNGTTSELALQQTTQETSLSSHDTSAGSNKTLKILLNSKHLKDQRLPLDSLVFERTISKGASGEVWICVYKEQNVAAKRLLQTKEQKAEDVLNFAQEIELSASLVHPHIIEFIGVAWNSLNHLVMVLEFCPKGNLQSHLHKNRDLLSWARDKIYMAVGIAQALGYLHVRTLPVIHRDLKSNNILLAEAQEPKLFDFGVSRGLVDFTMTAGVGTPYWTAPEILESKRYREQADIYSFGVVLTELDTGRIPYFDAVAASGNKFKPFQILQGVMAGRLRPSFANDCPPRILRIGSACLAHNPSSRPSARELVHELEGGGGEYLYSL